jgi:hypothetical protein
LASFFPKAIEFIGKFFLYYGNIWVPSFPSALQLMVSFGLLNNQPPFLSVPHLSRW